MKKILIICTVIPFILIFTSFIFTLIKNTNFKQERKIILLETIITFSLFFGILNFFFLFVFSCYCELDLLKSIEEIRQVKSHILLSGLKTGLLSPILGSSIFVLGKLIIKKIKLNNRSYLRLNHK